jgi:uncharacterized membrane protein YccF (DUF307 family)
VRRDLREIALAVALLILGLSANRLWVTHIGGWREIAAVTGGVVVVAMVIVLPVALAAPALRRSRRFVKPS